MTAGEQQQGGAPARKTTFDDADRAAIRATLDRYMKEHDIGVPRLIKRMAEALKRQERYIPQKSVQRFLAGEMRTNDATVSIFHEFARTLPPGRDDIAELSLALTGFFAAGPGPADPNGPAVAPGNLFETYQDQADRSGALRVPRSRLSIEARLGAGLRVREEVFPPALEHDSRAWAGGPEHYERRELFEGVLVVFRGYHVAVLRSTATPRHARIHWLSISEDDRLRSLCQSAGGRTHPRKPRQIAGDLLYLSSVRPGASNG
jgi:hypothetical protein